jgi:hypothetical protein
MQQTRCWTEFSYAPVGASGFFGIRTHGLRCGLHFFAPPELGVLVSRWREDLGEWPILCALCKRVGIPPVATELSFGGFACITPAAAEELSKSGYAVFCLQGTEVRSKQARPTSPPDSLGSFD